MSSSSAVQATPLLLLSTGTALAILAQKIVNMAATAPASHTIPLAKYACGLIVSASLYIGERKPVQQKQGIVPNIQRAEIMAFAVGCMDVVGYLLNCIGFPLVGSALSMVIFAAAGQIFTAIARVFLLKKRMSKRQCAAITVIILGVAMRYTKSSDNGEDQLALGVTYTTASAAVYSLLGVIYERLATLEGAPLSHTQISLRMSLTGFILLVLYQACYTWPNRQQLLLEPLAASGHTLRHVIVAHIAFGVWFAGHALVQGRVLQKSGAMAVGVVNSLRAATVSLASALLFCGPSTPQQCLDSRKGMSAFVITVGALLWATATTPNQLKEE